MRFEEFTINNLSSLVLEYPVMSNIREDLTSAYNMVLDKNIHCLPTLLTDEELDIINRCIKAGFALLETLPKYHPEQDPENAIILMLRISLSHWFYQQWQSKRKKEALTKISYIWQIPKADETALRRKFKGTFGFSPEQIIAGSFFFLVRPLIKSIMNTDLWTMVAILTSIARTNVLIQRNAKYITGGKIIHSKDKKLNKAYNSLKPDYPSIKNKPYDEQILYCTEHFNLSESDAIELLNRMKT